MSNATTAAKLEGWTQATRPDGTLRLVRRPWRSTSYFRQELLIRENYLEHRVVFGRWRRVVRITDGWVYLEQRETGREPSYRVRVRGKGGEVVLAKGACFARSLFVDTPEVPIRIAQLAEFVAQTTEWQLDVPYLLRRGSHIRTV